MLGVSMTLATTVSFPVSLVGTRILALKLSRSASL